MVHRTYKALIIEEYPIIRDACKSALTKLKMRYKMNFSQIKEASNCEGAYTAIEKYCRRNDAPDIVFLGIKLPPSKDKKTLSGEDIGIIIRKRIPRAKIIVSTVLDNYYRIYNILKNLNPAGFLIKSDVNSEELITAIYTVLTHPPYYSKTVLKMLRREITHDFILDTLDRKLLHELSMGTLVKNLPNILPLSLAGIEKRKRRLKEIFEVKSTHDLILKAKKEGFI